MQLESNAILQAMINNQKTVPLLDKQRVMMKFRFFKWLPAAHNIAANG
jgi:hypothetical protein